MQSLPPAQKSLLDRSTHATSRALASSPPSSLRLSSPSPSKEPEVSRKGLRTPSTLAQTLLSNIATPPSFSPPFHDTETILAASNPLWSPELGLQSPQTSPPQANGTHLFSGAPPKHLPESAQRSPLNAVDVSATMSSETSSPTAQHLTGPAMRRSQRLWTTASQLRETSDLPAAELRRDTSVQHTRETNSISARRLLERSLRSRGASSPPTSAPETVQDYGKPTVAPKEDILATLGPAKAAALARQSSLQRGLEGLRRISRSGSRTVYGVFAGAHDAVDASISKARATRDDVAEERVTSSDHGANTALDSGTGVDRAAATAAGGVRTRSSQCGAAVARVLGDARPGSSLVPCLHEAASVRQFHWERTVAAEHSVTAAANIALAMRAALTWQHPPTSWKWLVGGVYSVLVAQQVVMHLAQLKPASLAASAALGMVLYQSAGASWPIIRAVLVTPLQVGVPYASAMVCLHCPQGIWLVVTQQLQLNRCISG
jgi:hypothetical protein